MKLMFPGLRDSMGIAGGLDCTPPKLIGVPLGHGNWPVRGYRLELCTLAPMLKFRWAVQADYFAWRIAENNLTGISGPHDNEEGLEDARVALCAMSVGQ
jgi:hypothetical protein